MKLGGVTTFKEVKWGHFLGNHFLLPGVSKGLMGWRLHPSSYGIFTSWQLYQRTWHQVSWQAWFCSSFLDCFRHIPSFWPCVFFFFLVLEDDIRHLRAYRATLIFPKDHSGIYLWGSQQVYSPLHTSTGKSTLFMKLDLGKGVRLGLTCHFCLG